MPFKPVEQPVASPQAFKETGDAAVLSQAAILLMLGTSWRGDHQALMARADAGKAAVWVEAIPSDDVSKLNIPPVTFTGQRPRMEAVRSLVKERYGRTLAEFRAEPRRLVETIGDLAELLHRNPTGETAAQLLEVCLQHPHEIVRVAAAASYLELSSEAARLLKILSSAITKSREALVRDVAATALARVAPEHPDLSSLTRAGRRQWGGKPSNTSSLIHGTWAKAQPWWQPPNGNFYRYLSSSVWTDLYGASDRFDWTGGYSHAARALAANDLVHWVQNHNLSGLNLMMHSHGGSVAMLASHNGLSIGKLVLLSCPVHFPQYMPNFGAVNSVVSIRVHLDLVILADRGGQRFKHPQIRENVLPVWFDHSATHYPNVWQQNNVPAML